MRKLKIEQVMPLIKLAIEEDLGAGDITSELVVKADEQDKTDIVTREEIFVSGMDVAREILRRYDENLKLHITIPDGKPAHVGSRLGTIEGPLRSMLSAERVMLNFLQRMSGVATTTGKFVRAVKGTKARIYDTRKTTPGWRLLEKYAVTCGGGYNHRLGLYDGILIKDNHITEGGKGLTLWLKNIVEDARNKKGVKFVAVEVDRVDDQLNHVLQVPGIDIILLDNMGQWQLKHAVQIRNDMCGTRPLLEASGNVSLANVAAVAQCGVDRIAVGAITHSATAVDIGLDR
ncbi:MAG: carboxylating nicotinate-nucleotide diphosphorylase [Sedimentisphaerales bacterium]|nr:carboxylating nicotinate-nucleotide diphosphorylase [Sedimentisphaerales bacterium]